MDRVIDFNTDPQRYRHWKLEIEGPVAKLLLDVAEDGGLKPGYELKLNSYDLGVDIELFDAMQRLRFEHPEVKAVIVTSGKERVFSAGANIRMLSQSSHVDKVNFCKFTNETRNAIEESTAQSGQAYITAVNGPCAGGGYELALATDYILMADDGTTTVSLPEVPLLGVLPGTGGLTRLVDKRKVRRDRADFFCTTEEGIKGQRAVEWGLVDEVVPRTQLQDVALRRALDLAAASDRPTDANGIAWAPLARKIEDDRLSYPNLSVEIDRALSLATFTLAGPAAPPPPDAAGILAQGVAFWPLALAREIDDALLHLRFNEPTIGSWAFRSQGDGERVLAYDRLLQTTASDWLSREITLFVKRVLKRLDLSARSVFALIEPGSCFAGSLLEIVFAADRSFMLDGTMAGDNRPPAVVRLGERNFGAFPMSNGLSRIESRFLGEPERVAVLQGEVGAAFDAAAAAERGLVTFTPDDIDWEDEVRLAFEVRAAYSPDALTGLEASLRFAGPETLESKIFARLSAWQNWIFQRPNAMGENGALTVYGSGRRAEFDKRRA